jgi:hypothetical protein
MPSSPLCEILLQFKQGPFGGANLPLMILYTTYELGTQIVFPAPLKCPVALTTVDPSCK